MSIMAKLRNLAATRETNSVEQTLACYQGIVATIGWDNYYGMSIKNYQKALENSPNARFEKIDNDFFRKLANIPADKELKLKPHEVFDKSYYNQLVACSYAPSSLQETEATAPDEFIKLIKTGAPDLIRTYTSFSQKVLGTMNRLALN